MYFHKGGKHHHQRMLCSLEIDGDILNNFRIYTVCICGEIATHCTNRLIRVCIKVLLQARTHIILRKKAASLYSRTWFNIND